MQANKTALSVSTYKILPPLARKIAYRDTIRHAAVCATENTLLSGEAGINCAV
jgi:hypothetical protein